MSRTPIPDRLVHQPEEVKRNAERFDQLCRLAEEVAYPVVERALARETAATGVQALTDEAKLALEGLVADSALVELNGPGVLEEVRRSLEQAIPPPSEEECIAMTRDVAQVLMSTWLEILRKDLSSTSHLVLSDQLLPMGISSTVKQLLSRLGLNAPEPFREDGLGALALDESEASHIMKTLRQKMPSPRMPVSRGPHASWIGKGNTGVQVPQRPTSTGSMTPARLCFRGYSATPRICSRLHARFLLEHLPMRTVKAHQQSACRNARAPFT